MTFTREQKKEAYKKLSPEVQDFIMSNETTELIDNFLKEADLSEEQSNDADGEILYVLYGLQTLSDAIANIAKLSNKNINDLSGLKFNLENNIFNNIPQSTEKTEEPQKETPPQSTSGVGSSFEQIILNQAKAMRVAIPPENLPVEQSEPSNFAEATLDKKTIHNYIGENDPYRESIQ